MIRAYLTFIIAFLHPILSQAEISPLFIDDPKELIQLESQGFDFSRWFSGAEKASSNHQMYKTSKAYRSIVDTLSNDLNAIAQKDPLASVTMAKSHRLFNKKWLMSKAAHFELVGVVNRMDRRDFHLETCGELRFIYRLAYKVERKKQIIQSRLPLTTNVVSFYPGGDCSKLAKNWKSLKGVRQNKLKSIELNLQAVRWPSTIRPDFGGYAEYILRVFSPKGDNLAPTPLENTPDVARLRKDKTLRLELLEWLKQPENLKNLDNGTLVVPEKFLARKATSVALNGRARSFNHPFSRLYELDKLKNPDLASFKTFKTPEAMLKRVNDLSCVGCHQGRTVAGFHFLGKDRDNVSPVNAILSSFSAHFFNDQQRREQYWAALKKNKKPDSFRSLSVRAPHEKGSWGAHCSMGTDPSYSGWSCEKDLECVRYDQSKKSALGTCMDTTNPGEGSYCQPGEYRKRDNPHKDRIVNKKQINCRKDLICEDTSVGFPGGMCSGNCSKLGPNAACGSIAVLFGFNQCLAKGKPFENCLVSNVRPGSLRACNSTTHCRDDYICAKTSSGAGGCIPPYFLFQLRVDGHPKPI